MIYWTYGSKLSGWEMCIFCVTVWQFSSWPGVKMSHRRAQLTNTPRRVMGLHCFSCNLAQLKKYIIRVREKVKKIFQEFPVFHKSLIVNCFKLTPGQDENWQKVTRKVHISRTENCQPYNSNICWIIAFESLHTSNFLKSYS